MASYAKIAAVLLVLALFSAPLLEARELKSVGLTGGCALGYEMIGGACERSDNHRRALLLLGHPALTGQTHPALQGGVVNNHPLAGGNPVPGVAGGVGGVLGGIAGATAGALGNPGYQPPNNGFNQNGRRYDPRNNRNNQNRGNQNFNQNRGNQNRGGNRGSRRGY